MLPRFTKTLAQRGFSKSQICSQCHTPASSSFLRATTVSPQFPRFSSTVSDRLALPNKAPRIAKVPASHKPPKRRLEAASQPLRNAPSMTRGPVLQCIAHTTAEKYDLSALGRVLKSLELRYDEVPEGDPDRAIVIGPWKGRGGTERSLLGKDSASKDKLLQSPEVEWFEKEGEDLRDMGFGYGDRGEIWVFGSGSFVSWGLTEEEGRAFLRKVIRAGDRHVEINRLPAHEAEVEEVDFVVDPTAKTHILGNLILLGGPPRLSTFHSSPSLASLLARYTLSLSLSRSSSLSVLEERLDTHLRDVSILPMTLMKSGKQPLPRKEVIRKMGELMTLRMAANTSGGGLDDTPEFYWSEPELESYFDSVASEFEIKERIGNFNRKLDYAEEVQNTLRALLTESSAHRMEIIIILLISVEVVIVLIREGRELADKFEDFIGATRSDSGRLTDETEKFERSPQIVPLVADQQVSPFDWNDSSKRYV